LRVRGAGGNGLVSGVRLRERIHAVVANEGVNLSVHTLDLIETRLRGGTRRNLALRELRREFRNVLPAYIGPFEGEVVGVLFFGVCGVAVLLTPFLDRGRASRLILNGLVAIAVVFFILMTAWGWFPQADQRLMRIMLGALLTTIALFLLIPSTNPRTGARQMLNGCLALALLVLLVAACWEVLA
jgi:hypothetical protein